MPPDLSPDSGSSCGDVAPVRVDGIVRNRKDRHSLTSFSSFSAVGSGHDTSHRKSILMSSAASGNRVLVTGATGLLGSHLVERLVAQGHPVRALVRETSRTEFLDGL